MKKKVANVLIYAYQGDITLEKSAAIVNAANTSLRGGGGVDGAIHRAGGAKILAECKKYAGCPTGEVRTTSAGNLKAKYIFHTPGPIYRGGREEPQLLANCYKNALMAASNLKIKSIAFPSISTGVYGYPIEEACSIACNSVVDFIKNATHSLEHIHFVLFSIKNLSVYEKKLREIQT